MSKTEAQKQAYSLRREHRLRRDKTAAIMMPWCMANVSRGISFADDAAKAAKIAVEITDALLAELDRTRPDLKAEGPDKGWSGED